MLPLLWLAFVFASALVTDFFDDICPNDLKILINKVTRALIGFFGSFESIAVRV